MKNIYLVLSLAVIIFTANTANAQITIKGGANFTNYFTENSAGDDFDYSVKTSYHLGITAETKMAKIFTFETGVILDSRGAKDGTSRSVASYEEDYSALYATIPLNVKLKPSLGDLKVFVTAGPYASIGLLGTVKSTSTIGGVASKNERDIKWGDDKQNDDLKRFDYGLSVGGGIQLSSLIIGVEYSYGIANIASYRNDDNKIQNRMMRFSVGFIIGD